MLPPGGSALVRTGIAVALPSGTEGQVRPRSGLALNHSVTVLNAPGTIDEGLKRVRSGIVGPVLVFAGRGRIDDTRDMAGSRQHVFHRTAEELRAVQDGVRGRDVVLAGGEIVDRHLHLGEVEQRVVEHHAAGG